MFDQYITTTAVLVELAQRQYALIAAKPAVFVGRTLRQMHEAALDRIGGVPTAHANQRWVAAFAALGYNPWCMADAMQPATYPASAYCQHCPLIVALSKQSIPQLNALHPNGTTVRLYCTRADTVLRLLEHAALSEDTAGVQRHAAILTHAAERFASALENGEYYV